MLSFIRDWWLHLFQGGCRGKQHREWKRNRWRAIRLYLESECCYDEAKADLMKVGVPAVFPPKKLDQYIAPWIDRPFSGRLGIYALENALVMGRSNLAFAGTDMVVHDCYAFDIDILEEELNKKIKVDASNRQIKLSKKARSSRMTQHLPQAASFLHTTSYNYAHWLIEVLPRVTYFCGQANFAGVPLLIDHGLHPNIMQSLRLIAGDERPVILLKPSEVAYLERMIFVMPVSHIPHEARSNAIRMSSHGEYVAPAMMAMRKRLLNQVDAGPKGEGVKIFIKRMSAHRLMLNQDDVETALLARGFIAVQPEQLDFMTQVRLFASADILVGATGAGFANLLFCKPAAKIVILTSDHPEAAFMFWQILASSVGLTTSLVIGELEYNETKMHGNFKIDLGDVLDAIV